MNRSEQCFIQALLKLMHQKPFQEITVKELSKEADYDRKTFYRHFTSKEDILNLYCSEILSEMAAMQKSMGNLTFRSGILSYFAFWESHTDFLYLLDKNKLLYFLEENQESLIYEHVGKQVQDDIPETIEEATDFSKYSVHFTYGGLWNVLVHWIREQPLKSPEEVTEHILEYLRQAGSYIAEDE